MSSLPTDRATRRPPTSGTFVLGAVAAAAIALLAGGAALANPEAGGAFAQTADNVAITGASTAAPTILSSVSIRCPAAGTLVADGRASFQLSWPAGSTIGAPGIMYYGISRAASFDIGTYVPIQGSYAGSFLTVPGAVQRFDRCKAGQKATYRFYALHTASLGPGVAFQPRMSVIFLRDAD